MLVPTKYYWNISFQKKSSSKYVVKNARSVTHFVRQTFFPLDFKGLSNKKTLNIHTRILDIMKLQYNCFICQEITYTCWCFIKNKVVTLKNLILKYIGREKINIWKRKCHVEIDVLFLEVILKLYDVCFMKHIFIVLWTCLHHFDLHIIIRWPENVRRVNKICLHCGHFIHCYILLNFI